MSLRNADWREANIRIRRVCPEAFVTYTPEQQLGARWQAWERMTIPLTLDENLLNEPGMTKDTEAVVCAAPTWGELLHKYGLVKTSQREADAARERGESPKFDYRIMFRDRVLRGEESMPPPDPPEWAEYRAKMSARAVAGGERTAEQVRATVRNFMALQGLNARDMTTEQRRALGIGRLGDNWRGR